jgi:hypothetical protein
MFIAASTPSGRSFEALSKVAAFAAKLSLWKVLQPRRLDRPMASETRAERSVLYAAERPLHARQLGPVKLHKPVDGAGCAIVPGLIQPIEMTAFGKVCALPSETLKDGRDLLSSLQKLFCVLFDGNCFHEPLLLGF